MKDFIALFTVSKDRSYIGEPISQLEHALQAAHFATAAKVSEEEILAALLHDIGHLLDGDPLGHQGAFGIRDHEKVGARFLKTKGAPDMVCELVQSHVQTKRYLVFKSKNYRLKLSPASLSTFLLQGGPMTPQEAQKFERDPLFRAKVALRNFDDRSKVVGLEVAPLSTYEPLLKRHFTALSEV